ncbi:unnamed protein product [Prunus armeniaca]|uniref:FBD domain-containing protein n=1 Tax=Prunus armeniaca TaxID=36596 RepID=A0A6J5XSN5_PRUAR|nr:unnamed protein product [Prunus armeniaca]
MLPIDLPLTPTHTLLSSGFGMEYWKLQNLALLLQLKEVTIEYSDNGSNEIEFARGYILEHAQNLKKMVIVLTCETMRSRVVAEIVSKSKMISTAAVIIRVEAH